MEVEDVSGYNEGFSFSLVLSLPEFAVAFIHCNKYF